ncbi:MAG: type II secretion system F family protein [Candidatus Staskawiczbacteria bacterium]|nr:type II secretion system F family protein [Candidatus Staskawiczbacteria bacterium]
MIFNYKVRTKEGELKKGSFEASSREEAVLILQKQQLIITELSLQELPFYKRELGSFRSVSKSDVVLFSRQLSFLFEAKIPLTESLKILGEQVSNTKFKRVIEDISYNVEAGMPFSRALANHKDIFSSFYVSLVRSGEVAGKLQDILSYLANYQEREFNLVNKIKSAITYPIFILVFFVVVITLMLVFVVPQLTAVFADNKTDLPFITTVVITASEVLKKYYLYVVSVLVLLWVSFSFYRRTQSGQDLLDSLKLKIPFLKNIYRKFYLARTADTMATMITGGLPILQAIQITTDVVGNKVYREVLIEAEDRVKKGVALSNAFKKDKNTIPSLFSQMIVIGEVSGKLDLVFKSIAEFYQREINYTIDRLMTLIEPILTIALGIFIGAFIFSIILPIYNIVQTF